MTGSGKTLAYALPLIHKIITEKNQFFPSTSGYEKSIVTQSDSYSINANNSTLKGIILLPTRELCLQVEKVLNRFNDGSFTVDSFLVDVGFNNKTTNNNDNNNNQLNKIINTPPTILVSTPPSLSFLLSFSLGDDNNSGGLRGKESGKGRNIESGKAIIENVSYVVLDEADKLLSFGFKQYLFSFFQMFGFFFIYNL
jgi:superfamily II DNA/RNA helicase